MAKRLKVLRTENDEPGIECPRCGEVVCPTKSPLFEGWDCPECSQVIDDSALRDFKKALKEQSDKENYGDFDS